VLAKCFNCTKKNIVNNLLSDTSEIVIIIVFYGNKNENDQQILLTQIFGNLLYDYSKTTVK